MLNIISLKFCQFVANFYPHLFTNFGYGHITLSANSACHVAWLVGCVRFNVPLDTFLGHFGDGGVTATSARIIAAASAEASSPAQPHSVCGVE